VVFNRTTTVIRWRRGEQSRRREKQKKLTWIFADAPSVHAVSVPARTLKDTLRLSATIERSILKITGELTVE